MKKFLIPLSLTLLVFAVLSMGFAGPSHKPILTITGIGAPGETLDINVVNATPDATIAIFGSFEKEGVTYSTPWGNIHMCIGPHLFLISKGTVDGTGNYADQFIVPNYPPQLSGATVWFQGLEGWKDPAGVHFETTTVDSIVLE